MEIDEFVDSLTRITTSDLPIEFVRMMKQISLCRSDMSDVRSRLDEIDARLTAQPGAAAAGRARGAS